MKIDETSIPKFLYSLRRNVFIRQYVEEKCFLGFSNRKIKKKHDMGHRDSVGGSNLEKAFVRCIVSKRHSADFECTYRCIPF